ncbi:MAG: winged helix-turn-helix transcriptional regulator [Rhodobacteraceae bacterium]|nr:winged helix-turn-helix transcriptional regulator [Paracoccaceae bacterium]
MNSFDLSEFLPYQLAVLSQRVSDGFSTLYRSKYGLTVAEWRVVAHLSQSDKVSVREIHERVAMEKSKASRAASRLEAAGYVSKTANPNDGRLVSLALTPTGRRMMEDLVPMARAYEAELLNNLGDTAPQFLQAVASLLHDAMEAD